MDIFTSFHNHYNISLSFFPLLIQYIAHIRKVCVRTRRGLPRSNRKFLWCCLGSASAFTRFTSTSIRTLVSAIFSTFSSRQNEKSIFPFANCHNATTRLMFDGCEWLRMLDLMKNVYDSGWKLWEIGTQRQWQFFSGNLYACRLKNVLLCERKNSTARKISLAFPAGVRGKLYHSEESLDPFDKIVFSRAASDAVETNTKRFEFLVEIFWIILWLKFNESIVNLIGLAAHQWFSFRGIFPFPRFACVGDVFMRENEKIKISFPRMHFDEIIQPITFWPSPRVHAENFSPKKRGKKIMKMNDFITNAFGSPWFFVENFFFNWTENFTKCEMCQIEWFHGIMIDVALETFNEWKKLWRIWWKFCD